MTVSQIAHAEPREHRAAREIMGRSFLGLPETRTVLGLNLPATVPPIPFSSDTLKSRRETHVLMIDLGRSILDMRSQLVHHDIFFWAKEQPWYHRMAFASLRERVQWRLFNRTVAGGSTCTSWESQLALLDAKEEIPRARRVVSLLALTLVAKGVRLLERCSVRTNDLSYGRYHVVIEYDNEGRLCVNDAYDHDRYDQRRGIITEHRP